MANDPQFTNLPLIAAFLKHYSRAYLGFQGQESCTSERGPTNGTTDVEGEGVGSQEILEEFVPKDTQNAMKEMFVAYFNSASKTLVKGQIKLLEQDKKNHEAYIKSGEIFEDRQHAYERMTRAVERLTSGVQGLAELLDLPQPVLPTAASLSKSSLHIIETTSSFTVRDTGPVPGGIWDDEEEKRFYEELADLKNFVPASFLGAKGKRVRTTNTDSKAVTAEHDDEAEQGVLDEDNVKALEAQKTDEDDVRRQLEQLELQQLKPNDSITDMARTTSSSVAGSPPPEASQELNEAPLESVGAPQASIEDDELQPAPAARLSAMFAALPDASNREMVDRLAVEFASLNSKAARNRLIKILAEVPRSRTDLLPHYSRLVATLDPYMPDIAVGLIDILEEELRLIQTRKEIPTLDRTRLSNLPYYGELAKFKVAKPHTILHVLKIFLDDFRPNIENIANLLESCGRFLLRYDATAETAKNMVS